MYGQFGSPHRPPAMSSMGVVLEKIRERRIRERYREPRPSREHMPPDLAVPCANYPTAALLCFLAVVVAVIAAVFLLIVLAVIAGSSLGPLPGLRAAPG